nr:thioredoxin family protein [uncultured Sellimonas sp.]
MDIKVIGAGCKDCDKLYKTVKEAVEELGMTAEVQKVEDLLEIVQLGVMSAPSLMIDGNLVVAGRVPGKKEIVKLLQNGE